MKIHPIQTGIVRARPFQLFGAPTIFHRYWTLLFTNRWTEWLPIYSFLIEHPDGPILIDVGETNKINQPGYLPNNFLYHKAVQTKINEHEELDLQLREIGFSPKDISRVILTHLHGDHVGGLYLFPHADIEVSKPEYQFASSSKGPGMGYFNFNWPSWFEPKQLEFEKRKEGSFPKSIAMTNDEDVVAVPTPGHSIGHISLIVHSAKVVLSGDAVFNQETLDQGVPSYIIPHKSGVTSVQRLKDYLDESGYTLISSHDWEAPQLLEK